MTTITNATNIPRWNPDEQQGHDPDTTFALLDLMPRPGSTQTQPATLPAPSGGPINIPGPSNTAPGTVPVGQPGAGVSNWSPLQMNGLVRDFDNAFTNMDWDGVPRNDQSIGGMSRSR